jgi:hypothetical protein
MTLLTLELPSDLYERLRRRADKLGKTPQQVAEGLLARGLAGSVGGMAQEREQVTEVLRAAGLLTGITPDEKRRAEAIITSLPQVRAALDRVGGKPLSDVIIEMRGPKE